MDAFWVDQLKTDQTKLKDYFDRVQTPWEALDFIGSWISELFDGLGEDYQQVEPGIWIHKSAKIYPNTTMIAPVFIDEGSEVRPGAFLRGNVIVGKNCVVGNSTEIKNSILFNNVQVPHYNYVGDSVLGYKAHMGAGSITSNVKSDKSLVVIHPWNVKTGRKKLGAIIAHDCEIGCNSVLNPGTILLANVQVYPLSSVRGVVDENRIYKDKEHVIQRVIEE